MKRGQKMKLKRSARRSIRFVVIVLASLWIMFEEWVWDTIMALMEKMGHLKIVNRFETFLTGQNPYLLLSLFLFPVLIMLGQDILHLSCSRGQDIERHPDLCIGKRIYHCLYNKTFFL